LTMNYGCKEVMPMGFISGLVYFSLGEHYLF